MWSRTANPSRASVSSSPGVFSESVQGLPILSFIYVSVDLFLSLSPFDTSLSFYIDLSYFIFYISYRYDIIEVLELPKVM